MEHRLIYRRATILHLFDNAIARWCFKEENQITIKIRSKLLNHFTSISAYKCMLCEYKQLNKGINLSKYEIICSFRKFSVMWRNGLWKLLVDTHEVYRSFQSIMLLAFNTLIIPFVESYDNCNGN